MQSKTGILALDLASVSGWAVSCSQGGAIDLRNKNRHRGQMGVKFGSFLERTNREFLPDLVVIEAPPPRLMGAARMILLGLFWQANTFAATKHLNVATITATELKKWACGNHRATKEDMIVRAQELGCDPQDDNHADAFLLLAYQSEVMNLEVPQTRIQSILKDWSDEEASHWALQNCS